MKRKPPLWIATLALVILFAALNGCATRGVKLPKAKDNPRTIAYARAAWPFAMMSALAYEPETYIGDDLQSDAAQAATADAERRTKFEGKLSAAGWKRADLGPRPFLPDNPLHQKYSPAEKVGLAYDIWINELYQPKVIAIAIRGTEFATWQDWKSNFWWLTRHVTDQNQYRIVQLETEAGYVFQAYAKQIADRDAVVITTGHSLGGGLAQCLRYAYPASVEQAYAFDPSPVTGFSDDERESVSTQDRNNNNCIRDEYESLLPLPEFPAHRTLRIYAKGEILAYGRGILRFFYPITDNIIEIRFDGARSTFDPLGHHSIDRLAEDIFDAGYPTGTPVSEEVLEQITRHHPWWQKNDETAVPVADAPSLLLKAATPAIPR